MQLSKLPKILVPVLLFLIIACNQSTKSEGSSDNGNVVVETDPLPSWNDGASKQSIIEFVTKSVTAGDKGFVPVADRIACFDNDGTLWSEQPLYFQLAFALDQIKELAPTHPEWKTKQPFKAVLDGDLKAVMSGGEKSLALLMAATHAGITTDSFHESVSRWMATATHPQSGKHYNEMIYQPMLDLLQYLRANDYKTFIVSGGGIDFMRAWAEDVYSIPPYQVVGSSGGYKYDVKNDTGYLQKLPELYFNDDKEGKPVGIIRNIGKTPVFTAGNSDGDYAMLQYTSTGSGPHFGLIVHHTDSVREYAYDRNSHIGKLSKGLDDAGIYHWTIVDMKNDWKKIYPFDK